jgi:uncharacterized beta-barrel protein YwiB (DUF1934 family)
VEDTGDSVEIMAPGKYYMRNDKHYVIYDDIDEESGVKTKNTIKFNQTSAEVLRKGDISGKITFDKGKNNQSLYSTPFGDLFVEVLTKDIHLSEQEKKVNLKIDYELYANNNKVSDSKIEIDINRV